MAHLCLINPPGIKTTSGLQMHTPNPPIGLAYVAAAARSAGHRVTVIDATGEALDQISPMKTRPDILVQGLTREQVVNRIPEDVDAIGLGCTFSTLWPISHEILDAARAAFPKVPIIVGGEHPSAVPEHTLRTCPVDICVVGEGEETIVDLLETLDKGRDLASVPGLVCRDGTRIHSTPRRGRMRKIDAIPLPAWDLFPVEDYIERKQMNGIHQGRAMPILGTRGCPYRCTFCSSPQMWTTGYQTRDVKQVCDEIELYMQRYGATDFHFQDLTAIIGRKWIIALANEIERRGLNITWQLPSGTRAESIDDEVCHWLARTGCRNIAYAPESGSDRIRQAVQKRVKIDALLTSIRSALRHRLSLSCFFVIGFPQDTPETLGDTLRLIRRLAWMGVHDVGVAKFVPYPGSSLFRELLGRHRVTLNDDFFLSPIDFYGSRGLQLCYADGLNPALLHRWMIWLYLNFYVLSFIRRPLRALANITRSLLSHRENTRYAKWVRDMIETRRQWRRAAIQHGTATASRQEDTMAAEAPTPAPQSPSTDDQKTTVLLSLPVVENDHQEAAAG